MSARSLTLLIVARQLPKRRRHSSFIVVVCELGVFSKSGPESAHTFVLLVTVHEMQNLTDLPPKVKILRLLNQKGNKNADKCPEKHISWALIIR
jgi:hypothetical protein